ncbi:hypothetical protein ACO22_04153 [Paracoccidioides brasiliensis]|uniref:Uncharacterized protein n=1 Tax=Paracoccidioides brasiliensis TaxID=121759 RepID=A0A1D2JE35_PARBR|nr:hypothetical protein ACO22_04153 [Paracoccidioides brasiliensis]
MASSPNRARCNCNQVLRLHRKAWRKPLSEAICVGEKVNLAPKAPHGEARFAACVYSQVSRLAFPQGQARKSTSTYVKTEEKRHKSHAKKAASSTARSSRVLESKSSKNPALSLRSTYALGIDVITSYKDREDHSSGDTQDGYYDG